MQRMGLQGDDLRAYHRALRQPVVLRRFHFSVHDMDGRIIDWLTPDAVDGQIVVDRHTTPSRILNLTLVDPRHAMDFDPNSPAATGLHYTRQLKAHVGTYVPELGDWVTCIPFYGPIRSFDRDGDTVVVTAHGRDALGTGQLWTPYSRKKGTAKTAAIRDLLDRYGETHRSIPTLTARLPHALNLGRQARPWPEARRLAASMNRQLFSAGPGVATLRAWPNRPAFTFDDYLTSKVRANRQIDGVINAVEVLGKKPKGSKTRIRATATLRYGASLSGASLAPAGGRVWLTKSVSNTHIRSKKEAQSRANHLLAEADRQLVTIEFDSLPVYHLDEGDMAQVEGFRFRLDKFTLPLRAGAGNEQGPAMTVGYVKRTTRA